MLLYLFSLHHAGLTHKLSKLSGVVQERKQKYKSSLESSQADNTQVHVKKTIFFETIYLFQLLVYYIKLKLFLFLLLEACLQKHGKLKILR